MPKQIVKPHRDRQVRGAEQREEGIRSEIEGVEIRGRQQGPDIVDRTVRHPSGRSSRSK